MDGLAGLADRTVGAHPRMYAAVLVALVVVIIIMIVMYMGDSHSKGTMLGTNPLGNLNTGSNNPLWQYQMGDAGWGGSMHSTYQQGQPRVWAASAEGGHDMVTVPQTVRNCYGANCSVSEKPPCAVSGAAVGEADALESLQAVDTSSTGSAKGMDDDELAMLMNGGH